MADYGGAAGRQGRPPSQWPASLEQIITVDHNRPTLVMFAHPLCPCTRATLQELQSMSKQLHGMLDIHILFYEPENISSMSDIWEASDLKKLASTLPDVSLHKDVDGRLATHFGAYTSGQVVLYGTDARLRFFWGNYFGAWPWR